MTTPVPQIRKLTTATEEIRFEAGRAVTPPLRVVAAIAVVANPYAGVYVERLEPLIDAYCALLGEQLGGRLRELLAGDPAEAFGKAGIAGLDGEVEHVSAILHNLTFGNPIRAAAGATSLLPSTEKRAAAGATVDIPLKHVHDHTVRSHHSTFEVRVGDAPRADELLIAVAAATGGRPHARLAAFAAEVGGPEHA
ncbi:amino acid synthesis family protein [Conexibacter sp. CPCC 206217]|uniref:amino acid synthesis family protein n=1 Tax=Conexibacter sp. CPCC 206217 TaxID=3064574 RepID=UPI00271F59A4|nr:amino acid synthesis family protein [Conexibacter sp. CPCC 206217]MDO8208837.1 amino acid synthesis family protein [Conexibacter sp. CPCC 206217]